MVGWHHRLSGHESEQTLGDSEGLEPGMLSSMGFQGVVQDLATVQHNNSKDSAMKRYRGMGLHVE